MAEDRDTEARWYVVHTYSGYENKVAQNLETIVENRRLQELIHEVKVPVELVPDIKDGKEREVERKLFPGYVLVKMVMTDDSWYIVRNTRGVTGFVGPSSKPIPLTDEEVDKLGVDVREVSLDYAVGDNVQIMNGPLEGFIGIVEGIDTDSLLDKDSRRGRLGDEAEGTVRIDRNDDRNQVTDILLRALVEFLRERHDVHAVLAKRRANRGSRGSFAGRNLEFDIPRYFLSHFVHLQKLW